LSHTNYLPGLASNCDPPNSASQVARLQAWATGGSFSFRILV
jgi:hypothetical protein